MSRMVSKIVCGEECFYCIKIYEGFEDFVCIYNYIFFMYKERFGLEWVYFFSVDFSFIDSYERVDVIVDDFVCFF